MARKKIRYAVVGQGYFAQAAILPAFEKTKNSQLVALFSNDADKLHELGERHRVAHRLSYDAYDAYLASGEIDAVYIALPNNMHCEYTLRAARAGIHVLCEKPMALNEQECERMIDACNQAGVKLMIAYRLHFEKANLSAIEIARSGELGDVRLFDSVFCQQVEAGNSRLRAELGGGPLYDIGIYCVNAARYVFRDEPEEVVAFTASRRDDPRFAEVEEQIAVLLRFPHGKIAQFTASFGARDLSRYELVGTKAILRVDPAYNFALDLKHELVTESGTKRRTFKQRDQVAPEIIYFSECIRKNLHPEPSGEEGLLDVRILRAIYASAESGRAVALPRVEKRQRPDMSQERHVQPHDMPELVHADSPSR
jgi:predicted dehydrogenase